MTAALHSTPDWVGTPLNCPGKLAERKRTTCGEIEHESSKFWIACYIQSNGLVGIGAGLGSQVTLYGGVEISGHSGPAMDVFANRQGNVSGANYLHNNGVAGDPRSATIRVDGNSEVSLRGGTVAQNFGLGILALVNSSVDLTGVSFSSNSGGVVVCDSSAYMVSDLSTGTSTTPGISCRKPHTLGNRSFTKMQPRTPDFSALKGVAGEGDGTSDETLRHQ